MPVILPLTHAYMYSLKNVLRFNFVYPYTHILSDVLIKEIISIVWREKAWILFVKLLSNNSVSFLRTEGFWVPSDKHFD